MAKAQETVRRRSFGIGGAGNIRTPAEATVVQKVASSGDGTIKTRRSILSISSNSATSGIFNKIFGKGPKHDQILEDKLWEFED